MQTDRHAFIRPALTHCADAGLFFQCCKEPVEAIKCTPSFAKSLARGRLDSWQLQKEMLIRQPCSGMLTSLPRAPSLPEGLPRGVGAASEGVVGVLGSDPDSPLLKRALTSDLAKRSRSAAPANKPAQHATSLTAELWKWCQDITYAA